MKASSKRIPSPSAAEQFPRPLMTFLKSKSRGRSRSTPMFASAVTEPTQDPSSPEVTCIGQVRTSSSAESNAKKPGGSSRIAVPAVCSRKPFFVGNHR
ncbi:UNVERIFIED_CONTAM: hypothetical protein Sangu_1491000 [Sesamum angustifolium]|uniref:Uncharacterized protein n=1 Tax=Sesamum angustifolium TaxID=2727405 RepID=A0AAW2MR04_9LAMI